MVTLLFLVRHGATEEPGGPKRYKGSLDVPLCALGSRQSENAGRRLALMLNSMNRKLDAIYASPLQRARKTAEIIGSDFNLSPVLVPDLRERSFGDWEGMTFDEIRSKWPDAFLAWAKDPLNHSPIGGETTVEVHERMKNATDGIVSKHDGGAVCVVAHGGVNRALICDVLGMPLQSIFRIEQDFACINIIEFWPDGFKLLRAMNIPPE